MEGWQVTLLVAAIGACSGSLSAIVNARIDARRKKKEREDNTKVILEKLDKLESKIVSVDSRLDGLEKAQKITMQDRIRWLATKYLEKGEISVADYKDLKTMHDIYHENLHGNGFLDDIMEDVSELPKVR